jgi:hypothetical protein
LCCCSHGTDCVRWSRFLSNCVNLNCW